MRKISLDSLIFLSFLFVIWGVGIYYLAKNVYPEPLFWVFLILSSGFLFLFEQLLIGKK